MRQADVLHITRHIYNIGLFGTLKYIVAVFINNDTLFESEKKILLGKVSIFQPSGEWSSAN